MIREARQSDAQALSALHVRTWQEAYEGLLPDDYLGSLRPEERLPMWEQLLASPSQIIVVSEIDGIPVGFAQGGPSRDGGARPGTGELGMIYLLKEQWGRGVGRAMHERLVQMMGEQGYERLHLWVMESNDRTRRWYERRGWNTSGRSRSEVIWGAEVPEVMYELDL